MGENTLKQVDRFTRELNPLASNVEEYFQDYVISMAAAGNALPVVTDATTNVVSTLGTKLYVTNINEQLVKAPVSVATGLDIAGDAAAGDGYEITLQNPANTDARFLFTSGGTGFFIEAQFTITDVSAIDEILVGFRKNEAYQAARATYTDYAFIGGIAGDLETATDLNNAGETLTDTTDNLVDGAVVTLRVEVGSDRKVTYSRALTATAAMEEPTVWVNYTFDSGDSLIPCIRMIQGAAVSAIVMNHLKCGYLN